MRENTRKGQKNDKIKYLSRAAPVRPPLSHCPSCLLLCGPKCDYAAGSRIPQESQRRFCRLLTPQQPDRGWPRVFPPTCCLPYILRQLSGLWGSHSTTRGGVGFWCCGICYPAIYNSRDMAAGPLLPTGSAIAFTYCPYTVPDRPCWSG